MSFLITKEALRILAMNNASCKVFGEKKIKNLKYLTDCARGEVDFDYDNLVANLPEPGIMYGSIKSFSKYLKKDKIDQETMLKFLGGQWHIQYVCEQTDMMKMSQQFGEIFAMEYLFAHILLVAEIVEISGIISARYLNGDMDVVISGLVKHPFIKKELVIGHKVLIHQALILEIAPNDAIENELASGQLASIEFMAIAKKLHAIDYAKFWNMQKWTEDIVKEL